MKIFRAKGNGEFEISNVGESVDAAFVKLKINTILPSTTDIDVYNGKVDIQYPIVPCHMATAVVSEDRPEYGLKRGTKVIINPYLLSSIDKEGINQVGRYGLNSDGFLRDFISVPIDNIIPFPDDVKENEAIFTELIAVALATINAFEINKGEYIAIIGSSLLTNIIAQLALYYQAIPICVANDQRYLELATKCGIYYTINERQEDVYQRVLNITGGRLAEHTVLHARHGATPHFLYTLAGRGGDCTITSVNPSFYRIEADISQISNKNLVVKGVSCGVEEVNSAVNILAQKQLNFSYFVDKVVPLDKTKDLFDELTRDPNNYICPIITA